MFLLVLAGIAGVIYRNASEHPTQQIVCPLDTEVCPDGTTMSRVGLSCTFQVCLPPNVSLPSVNISFAIPKDFTSIALPDSASIVAYGSSFASSTASTTISKASIVLRRYAVDASSTPLTVIQQTAIDTKTGALAPVTAYSSSIFGTQRFTIVSIERFYGTIDTAYYLARGSDVLRFDAIDMNVPSWNNSNLDISKLKAHSALIKLLKTLKVL